MRLIPFLASLSGCIAELQTQCTSDDQYIVSLPYTIQNSTLLSATAGICSEKNITYVQDVATFNVTIDINRCKLNTETYPKPKVQAKNLFMANITNLKVGRTGNGMTFTYLDMDIATECGRQMSYEISHEYGAIASAGSVTPDVGVNETDVILPGAKTPFTFSFQEYTNLFFNETRATGPRQAGTKSFVAITATNMDVTEYSFHVPSCKIITTTGKEQSLFRSVSEENSFIDLYKDYRTINGKQEFLLSHIFFVLDRNSTARYNLTCNVRVCAKDHLGESCDIVQSCSTNPCVHGTCLDTMTWQTDAKKTDYTCKCNDNYTGPNCDQVLVPRCDAGKDMTTTGQCVDSQTCTGNKQMSVNGSCSYCDMKDFCPTSYLTSKGSSCFNGANCISACLINQQAGVQEVYRLSVGSDGHQTENFWYDRDGKMKNVPSELIDSDSNPVFYFRTGHNFNNYNLQVYLKPENNVGKLIVYVFTAGGRSKPDQYLPKARADGWTEMPDTDWLATDKRPKNDYGDITIVKKSMDVNTFFEFAGNWAIKDFVGGFALRFNCD